MNSIEQTRDQIWSFASKPKGWRYGRGVPPNKSTISASFQILEAFIPYDFHTRAFLGEDGQIEIVASAGDRSVEITAESDGSMTFVAEESDVELDFVEGLGLESCIERLGEQLEKWSSLDSFTRKITTKLGNAFKAPPSVVVRESRFLSGNAQSDVARVFANTSKSTIQISEDRDQFSSELRNKSYQALFRQHIPLTLRLETSATTTS